MDDFVAENKDLRCGGAFDGEHLVHWISEKENLSLEKTSSIIQQMITACWITLQGNNDIDLENSNNTHADFIHSIFFLSETFKSRSKDALHDGFGETEFNSSEYALSFFTQHDLQETLLHCTTLAVRRVSQYTKRMVYSTLTVVIGCSSCRVAAWTH